MIAYDFIKILFWPAVAILTVTFMLLVIVCVCGGPKLKSDVRMEDSDTAQNPPHDDGKRMSFSHIVSRGRSRDDHDRTQFDAWAPRCNRPDPFASLSKPIEAAVRARFSEERKTFTSHKR